AHWSRRRNGSAGNQSLRKLSPADRPGGRGDSRGRRMNASRSRTSSVKRGGPWRRPAPCPLATVSLVQTAHRLLEFAAQQQRHDTAATLDGILDARHFLAARRMQHVGRDLLRKIRVAGVTDADAQAPEGRAGISGLYVAQAVVP